MPGWCLSTRPQMCNCTSGNLEIPGSMLASPRNDGWNLRPQDRSTCRRAALEIDMRLGDILQRVGVVDRHVQLAVDDGSKQRVGAFEQFRALADVVVEFRPGRKQRAVVVEFGNRERRHRTRGGAETYRHTARLAAVQGARTGGLVG